MRVIHDLSVVARAVRPRRGWNPARLFSGGAGGVLLVPGPGQSVFTDTAGTSPATQPGQAVARVLDLSGSGRHAVQATVAARPVLGRHPAGGIRNRANGSGSAGTNAAAWYYPSRVHHGITGTQVGTGIEGGERYVDIHFTGTFTNTGSPEVVYISNASSVPATSGQSWTASFTARRIAGSAAGHTGLAAYIAETNTSFDFLTGSGGAVAIGASDTLVSNTRPLTNPGTANARMALTIVRVDGATIDVTYRIKGIQFEHGAARSAYQTNHSAFDITQVGQRDMWYLNFDGVDDFLSTGVQAWGADTVAVLAGVHKRSDAMRGMIVESTAGSGARFFLDGPGSALKYTLGAGGSTVQVIGTGAAGFTAPHTAVLEGAARISTDTMTLSVNGAQVSSGSADQGTGTFADGSVFIGARGGASLFFNGRVYGLLAINRSLSAAEQLRARRHFAHLTGVSLP